MDCDSSGLKKELESLPEATKDALLAFQQILNKISNALRVINEEITPSENAETSLIRNDDSEMFSLCESQITKCSRLMVDVFKREIDLRIVLKESRLWIVERLKWCLDRLESLQMKNLENVEDDENLENTFISWIDSSLNFIEAFEKLFLDSWDVQKYEQTRNECWRKNCFDEMQNVCKSLKETVCSAVNIVQYGAEIDKKIVTARCHVLLREAKNLASEMFDNKEVVEDLNFANLKLDDLKHELHFPTVTLFLNILKENVCNLETSINKAILRLVFQSLIEPENPLNSLKKALKSQKPVDPNDMEQVKDFDLHMEILTLIGLFAISCSADKKRVTSLKSCIASLESIEPQLVPSILLELNNPHCDIVAQHWLSEVYSLRMVVFLIIDHTAFIEMAMEQFKSCFNELSNEQTLTVKSVQVFIQIGKGVRDYINTYFDNESSVFLNLDEIKSLSLDLQKVLSECKAASEVLLSKNNAEDVPKEERSNKHARMLKRLKLLFTIISKISGKISNKNNSDLSEDDDSTISNKSDSSVKETIQNNEKRGLMNLIHKMAHKKEPKIETHSRSTIARFKNEKMRPFRNVNQDSDISNIFKKLNFSFLSSGTSASNSCLDKTDEFILADISINENIAKSNIETPTKTNKSIFYKDKSRLTKKRNDSLRKQLFINHVEVNKSKFILEVPSKSMVENLQVDESTEKLNASLDLQITHILEQLSGLSNTISLEKLDVAKPLDEKRICNNVLKIKVNESPQKNVVNIKVCEGKENKQLSFLEDCGIDVSFKSNIPTPERLNDLQNLERRLEELKKIWQ